MIGARGFHPLETRQPPCWRKSAPVQTGALAASPWVNRDTPGYRFQLPCLEDLVYRHPVADGFHILIAFVTTRADIGSLGRDEDGPDLAVLGALGADEIARAQVLARLAVVVQIVLGTGIGYFLVSMVVSGIGRRIDEKAIPESFRGVPIFLATLAIMSLAVYAFA